MTPIATCSDQDQTSDHLVGIYTEPSLLPSGENSIQYPPNSSPLTNVNADALMCHCQQRKGMQLRMLLPTVETFSQQYSVFYSPEVPHEAMYAKDQHLLLIDISVLPVVECAHMN